MIRIGRRCLTFPFHQQKLCSLVTGKMKKILLVFDFDYTVIDENSDTYITRLIPGGKVPDVLKPIYKHNGWTSYMQAIFKHLHKNNVGMENFINCLQQIQCSPGMKPFLTSIPNEVADFIIISDSNTFFIDEILKYHNLNIFHKVYTNTAKFDSTGLLCIREYQVQDWCDLSATNLCKGSVLTGHVQHMKDQGVEYTHIGYFGDGSNDLCPSLCLREQDCVFPRLGYHLARCIEFRMKNGFKITASICPWSSALDAEDVIGKWCDSLSEDQIPEGSRLLPLYPKGSGGNKSSS